MLAVATATAREAPPEGARFGLATATFVVVSNRIGTGVLTTSRFTVYHVGSNQLMLILWGVGGVLALCRAPAPCELSAALPRSGSAHVLLAEADADRGRRLRAAATLAGSPRPSATSGRWSRRSRS